MIILTNVKWHLDSKPIDIQSSDSPGTLAVLLTNPLPVTI